MDSHQHDKVFIRTFAGVLGFLVAFTIVISIIARAISAEVDHEEGAAARLESRIKPVGGVFTDEKALLAAAPAPVARAALSGADVVAKVCGACHGTGLLNAPKIGDKSAWTPRGNLAQLTASAIKGKGQMPPRGGDPELTDDEIKAAIQQMLK
ncbi:MAG TPA: c-type cytochrome [Verrucomicrobiae bacterium]|nr:c-type cytochrome [Verrucomicrobiae bacterium]